MTISDPRFAAQLITTTGKIYRFDDPGCLAAFIASQQVAPSAVHSIWMNDYAHPERTLRSEDAVLVVSDRIRAPMNGGIAAFASQAEARTFQASVGGVLDRWVEVAKRSRS
jgi:copper chaperone NosL